ncbi:uncharacterized protein EI90DRAFT_3018917 [Cantharellus anzutake]|uniref:uncharacterized protein n=1 Tax=Cantharellus anzutake TaxID=1750568 RepID=UPI001906AB8D|nr:uncharacterized protein EI90DRAFT_3018917 [Cantharellus anzutake]KAF8325860.1 hypothetical protein EI90DRAFT_3018917 [Cantharellus anzutake]
MTQFPLLPTQEWCIRFPFIFASGELVPERLHLTWEDFSSARVHNPGQISVEIFMFRERLLNACLIVPKSRGISLFTTCNVILITLIYSTKVSVTEGFIAAKRVAVFRLRSILGWLGAGISKTKKRDPKNVADPLVPPPQSQVCHSNRSNAAVKAWETRRAKQAAAKEASSNPDAAQPTAAESTVHLVSTREVVSPETQTALTQDNPSQWKTAWAQYHALLATIHDRYKGTVAAPGPAASKVSSGENAAPSTQLNWMPPYLGTSGHKLYRHKSQSTLPLAVCLSPVKLAHDIKSWRSKLKKHLVNVVPSFYGVGPGVDGSTVQEIPQSGALEHPAIMAVLDYTFALKELKLNFPMACAELEAKLQNLGLPVFGYVLTMIKYILNQYKSGSLADPQQEVSSSEYSEEWAKILRSLNEWRMKPNRVNDWNRISNEYDKRALAKLRFTNMESTFVILDTD